MAAVGHTRQRCGQLDWGIALASKGFFDPIAHDLLRRAVKQPATDKGRVLAIERWLPAPAPAEDGRLTERGKGPPQGGVARPLVANRFVH